MARSSIYRHTDPGFFPRPVHDEPSAVQWRKSDIVAWLESLLYSSVVFAELVAAAMKKERQPPKTPTEHKDRTQLGEVRIHYAPGPDARDRLRRAFLLILSAA